MDPILLVPRWPFDDGQSQYRLVWNGGDSRLPLFAEPDPNSKLLGEVSYKDGDEMETTADYTAVYQPTIFRTKRSLTVEGRIHGSRSRGEAGQAFSKKLPKGSSIAVWLYAGDGDCYLGVGGRIIVGECPDPANYVGDFDGPSIAFAMRPLQKIWWVQISTPVATGWVPLDDRVYVDLLPLSGGDTQLATDEAAVPEVVTPPDEPDPVDSSVSAEEQSREEDMFGEQPTPGAVAEREEDLFGGDTEPEPSVQAGGSQRDSLGDPMLSDEDIEQRLAGTEDRLAIGAFSFLELHYAAKAEGDYAQFPIRTPSLLDVYLDGRPSPRVRAYARARLITDFTIPPGTENDAGEPIPRAVVGLDQLWLKFDVARLAFITVGKQRIKWGTGRFWNPTDFLNPAQRNPLEVAIFDSRLGVTQAKIHVPIESLGWNFYAIGLLDGARTPEDVGGALRAEILHGLTELTLSAFAQRDEPLSFGADISTGVWLFDLRAELGLLYDDPRPYYVGAFDLPESLPDEVIREGQLIPQIVLGGDLQIPYRRGDLLVLGGEYFYNDAGYGDASLYPWLVNNNRFVPFYAGRRYAGAYLGLAGPGSWDDTMFTATGLANLSDASFIARLDVTQTVLTDLRWNLFGNYHFGENGEFNYGLDIEPNIFLPDGVQVVPPLFEIGAGLQLNL